MPGAEKCDRFQARENLPPTLREGNPVAFAKHGTPCHRCEAWEACNQGQTREAGGLWQKWESPCSLRYLCQARGSLKPWVKRGKANCNLCFSLWAGAGWKGLTAGSRAKKKLTESEVAEGVWDEGWLESYFTGYLCLGAKKPVAACVKCGETCNQCKQQQRLSSV